MVCKFARVELKEELFAKPEGANAKGKKGKKDKGKKGGKKGKKGGEQVRATLFYSVTYSY